MSMLMDELCAELANKVAEDYDKLAFSILGYFGINNDNWCEQLDRVVIVQTDWNRHFFVDKVYGFSIMEMPGELISENNGTTYKVRSSYRVEFIESMIGQTLA